MNSGWAPLLALALLGCESRQAAYDRQCEEYAARTDIRHYVDQRTGRLDRDPNTNEIVDPDTGGVVVTASQERCLIRGYQKTVDRYEKGG